MSVYWIKLVATFSAIIPVIIGLLIIRKIALPYKLFIVFITIGLVVDIFGWLLVVRNEIAIITDIRYVYSFIEAMFYAWFSLLVGKFAFYKSMRPYIFTLIALFWLLTISPLELFGEFKMLYVFESSTGVVNAVLASFAILSLVEVHLHVTKMPQFWLLLGIFFYTFCTFFILAFVAIQVNSNLYYVHNLLNVLTNLIYGVGFWLFVKKQRKSYFKGTKLFMV